MTGVQRKQYEVLLRIRDFCTIYEAALSTTPTAQELVAAIAGTIDRVATTDMKKRSATGAARADRKREARAALIALLRRACALTKTLRDCGGNLPTYTIPASRSDQQLLTAGRQLAVDAAARDDEFRGHGIPSTRVADVTGAFEAACLDRITARASQVFAIASIRALLAEGQLQVRRLDPIVHGALSQDVAAMALWRQARRRQDGRGPRQPAAAVTPAPPVARGATIALVA